MEIDINGEIDVESSGTGDLHPKDFAMNEEVPFLLLENAPFFFKATMPSKCRAPKFEVLPTALSGERLSRKGLIYNVGLDGRDLLERQGLIDRGLSRAFAVVHISNP